MKRIIGKKFSLLFGLLLGLCANLALALTLGEAKAQGVVGEKVDGFIAAVTANPSAEVQALITSTNDGRRKVYADLAKQNNLTVEQVGIVSAEKLRGNAASGEYVQLPSGEWQRNP
ncbi:MAG: YdbL family protein [Pseudomonadales bacterium]|jgi:uncharacterized protein YdbL (DUF1318 family)|nr:YdbL family protein [Pseudomonadales bacterium]